MYSGVHVKADYIIEGLAARNVMRSGLLVRLALGRDGHANLRPRQMPQVVSHTIADQPRRKSIAIRESRSPSYLLTTHSQNSTREIPSTMISFALS
jgi:hypothetical protein